MLSNDVESVFSIVQITAYCIMKWLDGLSLIMKYKKVNIQLAINDLTLLLLRWHHSNGRKQRGTKEPLDEGQRGDWKHWLKTQHSEN